MKQYTNESQTSKLIELGFEKPRYECFDKTLRGIEKWNNIQSNYSIGELIEMLEGVTELEVTRYGSGWEVGDELRAFTSEELIDALYDMIIMLKEEGVI